MKKTLTIKRAILRRTLNLLGVCTVGLMAACAKYGVEISTFTMNLMGTVKSNDSLKTIENIEVSASNSFTGLAAYTDGKGEFSVNIELEEGDNQAHMKIADIDGSLNGSFITKDTVLTLSQGEIESGTKYGIEIRNGMNKIPLKKRLIFNIFKKLRETEISLHELTYLFWESTLRCNLHCIHCGSDCKQTSNVPDMPLADFIKVTEKVRKQYDPGKVMIVITGGEPLIRKDLESCGVQLSEKGFNWGIVTNGILLSESRLETLLNAGLSSITVSLDGLRESHNWMRNADCFDKVINSIERIAKNNKLVFDVVTCVNSKNFDELASIKKLLISLNVKKWRLFTISPIGRAKDNPELKISESQFAELMEFIKMARQENRMDVNYECEGFVGKYELEVRNGLYFCRAGINIASVLIDGSISACPNIDRNFAQGNIYKDDFLEIWNNKFEIMRQRDWMKCGECKDCEVFNWCSGNGMHLREFETKNVLTCQYNTLKETYREV